MIPIYNLKAFADDLDAIIVEAGTDYRRLVGAAKPLLEKLLSDMTWLPVRHFEPEETGHVQYLLFKHPANVYMIASVVFSPLFITPVHDHGTWGLVGVWRGKEHEDRFRRVEGSTSLRPVGGSVNTPGRVTYLIPPDEDIHRIRNLSSQPACSIHVYGREFHRRQYDL